MGAQGPECHVRAASERVQKTAAAVVQKPWCLLRAGAYLEKWVADNQAGTYGAPPTIPLLTDMFSCAPVWVEDMAVEGQDYAPAPPVRIEVGPAKKRRVEPWTVCGDRPRDVIPQVPGAGALALPAQVSGDDEMGFDSPSEDPQPAPGAGAPALPAPPPPNGVPLLLRPPLRHAQPLVPRHVARHIPRHMPRHTPRHMPRHTPRLHRDPSGVWSWGARSADSQVAVCAGAWRGGSAALPARLFWQHDHHGKAVIS